MLDLVDALLIAFYLFIFVNLFFECFCAFSLLKILHILNHQETEGGLSDVSAVS